MPLRDVQPVPDALAVTLCDPVLHEELRLLGEVMAAANRCSGRMSPVQPDIILHLAYTHACV